MLGSGIDLRDGHLDGSEEIRHPVKTVIFEPLNILDGLVDGVDTFISGSVAALPVGRAVQYHQSPLCDGHPHPGRLAHHPEINQAKFRQDQVKATFPAHLFLGGGGKDQPVRLLLLNEP